MGRVKQLEYNIYGGISYAKISGRKNIAGVEKSKRYYTRTIK
jgi:hypothetical protein